MRGKHTPTVENDDDDGITPADAGKTTQTQGTSVMPRDHPRGCGENAED